MRGLTTAEEQELLALLEAEYGGETFDAFIRRVAPREPPPPHLEPLVDALERARREPVRLIVEEPPRHAKSTTVMRGLVWKILRDPALLNAYVAYGAEQAEDPSRRMRQLAVDTGVQLRQDTQASYLWRTRQGGGLLATGIGGPITGKGIGGWLVVDDPHKDREEAESPRMRERVWTWFQSTAWSRLEGIASVIVVMQRWHVDDLVGRLLNGGIKGQKWELIEQPALTDVRTGLAADDDCPDEFLRALWPEREEFNVEALKKLRLGMEPYYWWSQYQQQPRARGAELFREPGRFELASWKPEGDRLIWAADPAATAKTSSDYSAGVLLAMRGFGEQAIGHVLDRVRVHEEVPAFTRRMAALAKARRCGLVVEAVGGFKAVPQMIREIAPTVRVVEVTPAADKFTRAQPLSAAWNQGRCRVPTDAPWADEYIDEFRAFTGLGDRHDDQVDATAHAWNALYAPRAPQRGPREVDFLPFG